MSEGNGVLGWAWGWGRRAWTPESGLSVVVHVDGSEAIGPRSTRPRPSPWVSRCPATTGGPRCRGPTARGVCTGVAWVSSGVRRGSSGAGTSRGGGGTVSQGRATSRSPRRPTCRAASAPPSPPSSAAAGPPPSPPGVHRGPTRVRGAAAAPVGPRRRRSRTAGPGPYADLPRTRARPSSSTGHAPAGGPRAAGVEGVGWASGRRCRILPTWSSDRGPIAWDKRVARGRKGLLFVAPGCRGERGRGWGAGGLFLLLNIRSIK